MRDETTLDDMLGDDERLLQLLADEATEGLMVSDARELESLLERHAEVDPDELALAAAAADQAFARTTHEQLPAHLRQTVLLSATEHLAQPTTASAAPPTPRPRTAAPAAPAPLPGPGSRAPAGAPSRSASGGAWLVAAAALLIAALGWLRDPSGSTASPDTSPGSAREQLLASASDVLRVDWSPLEDERFAGVDGDVVWSNAAQEGYMRLSGIPVNDPGEQQYQLWIVDPARDDEPVDGGVFDVGASGELIIPIDAKLRVVEPAAFALTLEKPGGVVVSAGPLLVVAAVES